MGEEEENVSDKSDMSFWRPREKFRVEVKCLRCEKMFLGVSKFNRICDQCKYYNDTYRNSFIDNNN